MIEAKVNQKQLQDQLNRLRSVARKIGDTTTANRKVAIQLYEFVARNFQTEGGMTEEGHWEPLADSTIQWKERHGYSMILQNEGELRDSFMPFSAKEYAGVGAQKLPPIAKSALKAAKQSDLRFDRTRGKGKLKPGQKPVKITPRPPDIAYFHEYGIGVPARPMLPTYEQALGIGMLVYNQLVETAVRGGP